MRAIVDAKEFSKALKMVSGVLKKSHIPVLDGVLVQVKDNICTQRPLDSADYVLRPSWRSGHDLFAGGLSTYARTSGETQLYCQCCPASGAGGSCQIRVEKAR